MSDPTATPRERPLSPHLQVYRWPLGMAMSILHRASGVALAVGTLMVVWWLVAAASGEAAYNVARDFAQSPLGTFMMFGWSAALYYHLCNGIRHLIWDTGRLFKIKNADAAGCIVLVVAALLTVGTWACVLSRDEGPSAQVVLDSLAGTFSTPEAGQ